MRSLDLTDPNPPRDRRAHPETVLLLVARGTQDNWGELEPLRGTSWQEGVSIISGEAYSQALHGRFLPLQRELGRSPAASARRVTPGEGECSLSRSCAFYEPLRCRPGGRGSKKTEPSPPDCWEPPLKKASVELLQLFRDVAMAWREGRHTVVVVGEGFNLR